MWQGKDRRRSVDRRARGTRSWPSARSPISNIASRGKVWRADRSTSRRFPTSCYAESSLLHRPSNATNLVLAIPHDAETAAAFPSTHEDDEHPPETPAPPPIRCEPQFPRGRAAPTLTDTDAAKRDVVLHLDAVCETWGIVELAASDASEKRPPESSGSPTLAEDGTPATRSHLNIASPNGEDFLPTLLTTTTAAVRGVQKFIATLPLDIQHRRLPKAGNGMQHLALSTSARPVSARASQRTVSASTTPPRPTASATAVEGSPDEESSKGADHDQEAVLGQLRRASLDVLGCLKDLEVRFRIPNTASPLAIPDRASSPLPPLPPLSGTSLATEADMDASSVSASVDSAGLAPSNAWDYRDDVTLEDIRQEAQIVRTWLRIVGTVLDFVNKTGKQKRGSGFTEPARRSASEDSQEPARDDGSDGAAVADAPAGGLPDWASPAAEHGSEGSRLQRAHRFLAMHLSREFSELLPDLVDEPAFRRTFFDSLSCVPVSSIADGIADLARQRRHSTLR